MTEVPQEWVDRGCAAVTGHIRRDAVAAVLAAVLEAQTGLLCSQCGEQPAAMVKIGTDDGWCTACLNEAAELGVDVTEVIDHVASIPHPEFHQTITTSMPARIIEAARRVKEGPDGARG